MLHSIQSWKFYFYSVLFILDPMLAGNNSPGMAMSEINSADENLEPAHWPI